MTILKKLPSFLYFFFTHRSKTVCLINMENFTEIRQIVFFIFNKMSVNVFVNIWIFTINSKTKITFEKKLMPRERTWLVSFRQYKNYRNRPISHEINKDHNMQFIGINVKLRAGFSYSSLKKLIIWLIYWTIPLCLYKQRKHERGHI